MKNYKNYFEADNSCYLVDKFNVDKRIGTMSETDDFWSDIRDVRDVRSKNFLQGVSERKLHS